MAERLQPSIIMAEGSPTETPAPAAAPDTASPPPGGAAPEQQTPPEQPTGDAPEVDTPEHTEDFYTDLKILKNHYPVHRMVREIGNQRIRAIESVAARWQNTRDKPELFKRRLVRTLAEVRANRLQKKYGTEAVTAHAISQRHQKKLKKANDRLKTADTAYTGLKTEMQGRREAVGTHALERRTATRVEFKRKREMALGRRALRHEIRESGAKRYETRAVIKQMPREHVTRVGNLAATTRISERYVRQAKKVEQTATNRTTRTQIAIDVNRRFIEKYNNDTAVAAAEIETLEHTTIPEATAGLTVLRNRLTALADADPSRASLEAQIQAAENQIAQYHTQVPRLKRRITTNEIRITALDKARGSLDDELTRRQTKLEAARIAIRARQETATDHATKRSQAAKQAIHASMNE